MTRLRRSDAIKRWKALATGKADAETLAWAASMASDVLAADALKGGDRRPAMLAAVQLSGQQISSDFNDAVRLLKAEIDTRVQGDGIEAQKERRRQLRDVVRLLCRFDGKQDLRAEPRMPDDDAIDALIQRAVR